MDAIDGWARDHYPRCKAHAEERDGEPREAIPAP